MTTLTDKGTIIFQSNGEHLYLERVAQEERYIPGHPGAQPVPGTGCAYQFENGRLEVRPDQDILPTGPLGEEESAVDWLRRHSFFGDRFFEIQQPVPAPDDDLREVTRLAMQRDEAGLVEMYDREQAGFNRSAVIAAIETALKGLEES